MCRAVWASRRRHIAASHAGDKGAESVLRAEVDRGVGDSCVVFRAENFFFQAEDGIRVLVRSRGLGDVYKGQVSILPGWRGEHCQLQSPCAAGGDGAGAFYTCAATL